MSDIHFCSHFGIDKRELDFLKKENNRNHIFRVKLSHSVNASDLFISKILNYRIEFTQFERIKAKLLCYPVNEMPTN